MNQKPAPREAHWNLIPLLRKGFETNLKFKSRAKASPFFYATRSQELRFLEEHHHVIRLCKGGCGLRCAAQPPSELSQENWSLALTARSDSTSSPGRWGFRRDHPLARSNFGRHSGRRKCCYRPPPLPRLCKVAGAPLVGPKTLHPRQPLESPTPNGDKGARGTLRRGVPSPCQPELRMWR